MAKDLKLIFDTNKMLGDLEIKYGDLATDEGLETAVFISLFTDRRARDDDKLLDDRNLDKRGWWGDLLKPDNEGDEIGSRLWLLSREKTTEDVFKKLDTYINEALNWLVEDEVVSKIETLVERQQPSQENNILAFEIKIFKIDGREVALNYYYQWDEV